MVYVDCDPRLERDSLEIGFVDGISVRLMNDARFLWVILVPLTDHYREWHDLEEPASLNLHKLARFLSRNLQSSTQASKVNIASLGNQVPQLHLHIVMRHEDDAAWPGPVWGSGKTIPMDTACQTQRASLINALISQY